MRISVKAKGYDGDGDRSISRLLAAKRDSNDTSHATRFLGNPIPSVKGSTKSKPFFFRKKYFNKKYISFKRLKTKARKL